MHEHYTDLEKIFMRSYEVIFMQVHVQEELQIVHRQESSSLCCSPKNYTASHQSYSDYNTCKWELLLVESLERSLCSSVYIVANLDVKRKGACLGTCQLACMHFRNCLFLY